MSHDCGRLRVSGDGRQLVTEGGTPFFYLGDTAWLLFEVLTREETISYLEDRASKCFTVIQAVLICREEAGESVGNAYGHRALIGWTST